jgi:hypothetical protein
LAAAYVFIYKPISPEAPPPSSTPAVPPGYTGQE